MHFVCFRLHIAHLIRKSCDSQVVCNSIPIVLFALTLHSLFFLFTDNLHIYNSLYSDPDMFLLYIYSGIQLPQEYIIYSDNLKCSIYVHHRCELKNMSVLFAYELKHNID